MLVLSRWVASFALITLTYNPTPYNYSRWAMDMYRDMSSLVVLAGLCLLIGYVIFLRATIRSLGIIGMSLFSALFTTLLWVLWDFDILTFTNPTEITWIVLVGLSLMLALGMSWSHIRRQFSGQYDIDDVDER